MLFLPLGIGTVTPLAQAEVDVEFRVYAWNKSGLVTEDTPVATLPPLYVWENGVPRPLRVTRGQLSPSYRYRGELPLQLVRKQTSVDGQTSYALYAFAHVSTVSRRIMLMLDPDTMTARGTAQVYVIDLSEGAVSPGVATFFNTASTPVRLVVRERVYQVPAGGRLAIARHDFEERRVGEMAFSRVLLARPDASRGWRQAATMALYVKPEQPNLFLIAERGNRLVVKPFYDLGAHDE